MAMTADEKAAAKAAKDAEKAAAKAAGDGEPITVKYRDAQGQPASRTYSADVHGENYAELAAEFSKTHEHRLIKE